MERKEYPGVAGDGIPASEELRACCSGVSWWGLVAGIAGLSCVLGALVLRFPVVPLVESDYCYLLMAADRMYSGLGFTSLQPVAPHQSWDWAYDWGFLTQWPIGYSLLVWAIRLMSDWSTLVACKWISVVACATALAAWFVWMRTIMPRGVTGVVLSAVAAACSLPAALLVNPSTDLLLIALLPVVLLLTNEAVRSLGNDADARGRQQAMGYLALAGMTAGALFWLRYASIFLPSAVCVYLLIELWRRLRPGMTIRHIVVFTSCAAWPVVTLLLINRALSPGPLQAQLNLGQSIRVDYSPGLISHVWWMFTNLGFYDYHWFTHWVYALWPAAIVVIAMSLPPMRRALRSYLGGPSVCLSAIVVIMMLVMLIAATTLFGDKFNYVGLERYYLPIRPLYFLLFAAPVLLIPRRSVKVLALAGLLIACSWIIGQDWVKPYRRWHTAGAPSLSQTRAGDGQALTDRVTRADVLHKPFPTLKEDETPTVRTTRKATSYGQWSRCFEPGADTLFEWLVYRASPDLVVVSNFHEYLALETGVPTLPIPKDAETLMTWVRRICAARDVSGVEVLFVLDPDNKWRDHWIAAPADIVQTFALSHSAVNLSGISAWVFEYSPM
ncbi:MAG: hypothetical protein JSU63_07920 [Phycisphaerales bacterium]|nr:MAG: hypothetical protein JSU63_07920 [Phycisphaerales bacterium]